MNTATEQAALGALRNLLSFAAGILVARGVIDEMTALELVGAVMVILPIAWSIWNQYRAEHKTQVREMTAMQIGADTRQSSANVEDTQKIIKVATEG